MAQLHLPRKPLTVALVQNDAGADIENNLAAIERMLSQVKKCDLIALPEVFALRGSDQDYKHVAERLTGPVCARVAALARNMGCWILAGSIIEKSGGRLFNTSVLFDRRGALAGFYRKIHLFEAFLDNGLVVREQDIYCRGRQPTLVTVGDWRIGLSICYDIRFPELYRFYSLHGAHAFMVPANFTQRTGRDHWEVLLRARAIENQCFIAAPNQCGKNPANGIASYGNTMAVGPWGEVLGRLYNSEGVLSVIFEPRMLRESRSRVPVLSHRRLFF